MQRIARVAGQVLPRPSPGAATVLEPAPVSAAEASGVLKGIRVVELATVVAAPTACALLADMGAEVVKIEAPNAPDISRGWGGGDDLERTAQPELVKEMRERRGPGGGSAYVQINRGKRSLCLDVSLLAGREVLKRMLATADVFVTNVRLKSLQKIGLDYETLSHDFPRLIYAQLSAFGRAGPKVEDPGYDYAAFWAYSGFMDIVRSDEGGDLPRFPGAIGDNLTAVQLAGFIGTALFHRERTGKGILVDAALMRSGIMALTQPLMQYQGGNDWGRSKGKMHVRSTTKLGERETRIANLPFLCKDGTWCQLLGEDFTRHWPNTLKGLGLTPAGVWGKDAVKPNGKVDWSKVDFKNATRIVDAVFATKTFDEWSAHFKTKDIWHEKVQRFEQMWEDPQAKSSGIFVAAPGVRHPLIGSPVLLGKAPAEPRGGAPGFGQHTTEVLRELGYSPAEEEKLRGDKVVR